MPTHTTPLPTNRQREAESDVWPCQAVIVFPTFCRCYFVIIRARRRKGGSHKTLCIPTSQNSVFGWFTLILSKLQPSLRLTSIRQEAGTSAVSPKTLFPASNISLAKYRFRTGPVCQILRLQVIELRKCNRHNQLSIQEN